MLLAAHQPSVRAATVSFTQLHSFTPHSVPLHYVAQFISAGFSPPAANFYFARRSPHLGCVHLAAAIAHSPSLPTKALAPAGFRKASLRFTCIVQPPSYRQWAEIYCGGFLCCCHRHSFLMALLPAPLWGLAVRLHFVVPPYSGGRQTARNPSAPASVRGSNVYFSSRFLSGAAGAFTGNPN